MSVDAKLVAELRAVTGAGIMDAKKALEIASGDIDKAKEELRKKGVTKAEKRAGRETKEGRIYSYIHSNGKVGAIVEIQCETDFVAKNEDFLSLCHDIAMHVTATQPFYLNSEDIPNDILENKKSLFKEEIEGQGKPADVVDKIVDGKMQKFYNENCLMNQDFIKDDSKTIGELMNEKVSVIGENIKITRFHYMSLGEK